MITVGWILNSGWKVQVHTHEYMRCTAVVMSFHSHSMSGPVGQAVEPARETPLLFGCPHAPARFGVGGTLVVVTPTSPSEYSNATVQLIQLKVCGVTR